ncbi:hypothetical protein K1W69_04990 [Hoeflea sp. WL0058]|uniref:Uncharacterized protein n=1 Tax=Flavimaribacter sediminis TaxID=2865987 RepID=A0AAE2ZIF6_9HYPH|nr:hypothetical protein [Flavimaribacter sediminis]MBW8636539.1 hypothetical protein [Flavimaribacter sediminis]
MKLASASKDQPANVHDFEIDLRASLMASDPPHGNRRSRLSSTFFNAYISAKEMLMYVRFVCADDHPTAEGELGMFEARRWIDFSVQKGSIQRAQEDAFWWFAAKHGGPGLAYPSLKGKSRTRNVRKSLFWFVEDSAFPHYEKGSVIRRARDLAWAITQTGAEIREIKTADPGRIIWRDWVQVLALPNPGSVPRAL